MQIDKPLVTNLMAAAILLLGYSISWHPELFRNAGMFALSGALTNWLAIYMLFEKVPLLYGSGVIPNQFERFKSGIKDMVMRQFFTLDNIQRFIEMEEDNTTRLIDFDAILDSIDYDRLYQNLVEAIMASSFGGMLGMFGGVEALEPLREPFIARIRAYLKELTASESFHRTLADNLQQRRIGEDMQGFVEKLVDRRLDELTPQMVKEIVQRMIRRHLGWLVVWGGVFGGLIGLLYTVI